MNENKDIILIVDDNINNIRLVGNVLREKGYQIAVAKDGWSALNILKEYIPSLILLDIMMPDMDGIEVINKIKLVDDIKDIPIIFLTAKNNPEDIIRGFDAGGVDYITKPFNQKELLVRVKNHIDLYKAKKIILDQAKELKTANDAKNKIFSVISHDMKTPLTTLRLVLERLMEANLEGKTDYIKEALNLMHLSADQTYDLLDNLLNWSRGQLGKLKAIPQKFIINDIIIENIDLLKGFADQKIININFQNGDTYNVFADKDMIRTVFRNILNNAIKYSFKNENIFVYIEHLDDFVEISTVNYGLEIPDTIRYRILENSFNESRIGTDGEKGTGLGLGICKKFIDLNNGKIWIEDAENNGVKFIFSVPVERQV